MAPPTLREAAALWALDLIGSERLPSVALAALEQGLDSPTLRQLAGESKPIASDAGPLFGRCLAELSLVTPDRNSARLIAARYYAKRILDGALTPYEGACEIWWGPANDALSEPEPENVTSWLKLKRFIGYASEYEDDIEHRAAYAQDIVQAAQQLVNDPEAA